jgi:hypothetical protein
MSIERRQYRVVPYKDGWGVETDGQLANMAYVTKEAAFEAVIAAAEVAMLDGAEVNIAVPGGAEGRWA